MIEWSNTNNWRKSQLVRFAIVDRVVWIYENACFHRDVVHLHFLTVFPNERQLRNIYESAAGDAHSEFRVIEGTVALS